MPTALTLRFVMPNDEKELEELYEALDAVVAEHLATEGDARDIVKTRIAFWDKLVVLNAGTLALTFSAASSFRGHSIGDGGVGYLFAAWKLLSASILLAIFAQWAAGNFIAHYHVALKANLFNRRFESLLRKLKKAGGNIDEDHDSWQAIRKAANFNFGQVDRISIIAGLLAQGLTYVAFLWVYLFARVNLKTL